MRGDRSEGTVRAPDPWEGTDLEGLSDSSRASLAAHERLVAFAPGDVVMREGRPAPFLGLVEAGMVALRVQVPGRGPHTVVTLERGDLIGWSSLVPPYRATADAVAQVATRIRTFDAEMVRGLVGSDCCLAAQVYELALERVSHRLTTSWQQLLDLFGMRGVGPW